MRGIHNRVPSFGSINIEHLTALRLLWQDAMSFLSRCHSLRHLIFKFMPP